MSLANPAAMSLGTLHATSPEELKVKASSNETGTMTHAASVLSNSDRVFDQENDTTFNKSRDSSNSPDREHPDDNEYPQVEQPMKNREQSDKAIPRDTVAEVCNALFGDVQGLGLAVCRPLQPEDMTEITDVTTTSLDKTIDKSSVHCSKKHVQNEEEEEEEEDIEDDEKIALRDSMAYGRVMVVFSNPAFQERFGEALLLDLDALCITETDVTVREKHIFEQKYLVLEVETVQIATHRANVEVAQKQLQFVAQASHEIRTPLAGLLGMIECLDTPEEFPTNSKRRSAKRSSSAHTNNAANTSEVLRQCANTLHAVVNDVLDLTACSSNQVHLRPTMVNLKQHCLDRVVDLFARVANRQETEIRCEPLANNFPELILVDEHRLNQVVSNLVGNAVKYTQSGKITIRAQVMSYKGQLDQVETGSYHIAIEVQDTGMGISEKDQLRIFEPFYQAKDTPRATIKSRKTGNGTGGSDEVLDARLASPLSSSGLGLAISRDLARVMGGDVSVESRLGKGSTFRFEFVADEVTEKVPQPLIIATEATKTKLKHSSSSDQPTQGMVQERKSSMGSTLSSTQTKVLVVDDNLVNCQVCSRLLKRLGVSCDIAHDGIEALDLFQRNGYKLIFMDCHMPNMDGFEATRQILARAKDLGNFFPTIVAMTASVMARDQAKCFEAGMQELLPKPFTMASLERIIDMHHNAEDC